MRSYGLSTSWGLIEGNEVGGGNSLCLMLFRALNKALMMLIGESLLGGCTAVGILDGIVPDKRFEIKHLVLIAEMPNV